MSNPRLASTSRSRSRAREAAERAREALAPIGRFLTRDRLSTFLLVASIALLIVFFSLLGSLGSEGTGRQGAALGRHPARRRAAAAQPPPCSTTTTRSTSKPSGGLHLYADYPASDAATQQIYRALSKGGAEVADRPPVGQASAGDRRPVPDPDPAPGLPLLLLHAPGRRTTPAGSAPSPPSAARASGARRARKRRSPSTRWPAPAKPSPSCARSATSSTTRAKYLDDGRRGAQGGAAGRPPGHRQDAARPGHRRRGRRRLLHRLRRRVRRVAGRGRRGAHPRPLRQGAQDGAGDRLHRRARRRRAQARRRRRPGQRRARADAQPAAGRDGRLRRRRRRRASWARPTAPTSSTRPCCGRGASTARWSIDVPDVHGRCEILELHAKGRSFAAGVDLCEIAKLCPGFSGAELANLVNEAALLSVREGFTEIDQATLEEAIDRVVAGPAKKIPRPDRGRALDGSRSTRPATPWRPARSARWSAPRSSRSSPAGASSAPPPTCSPTATR